MEATGRAASFNERQNDILGRGATLSGLAFLPSDVSFVRFNDLAGAAHWFGLVVAHRFTNAVCHEPRGLIGHAHGAMKLMGRETFFGSGVEIDGMNPSIQLDLAALKHGA